MTLPNCPVSGKRKFSTRRGLTRRRTGWNESGYLSDSPSDRTVSKQPNCGPVLVQYMHCGLSLMSVSTQSTSTALSSSEDFSEWMAQSFDYISTPPSLHLCLWYRDRKKAIET
ncbi:hypothetical protein ElyMa_003128600 [Elysia marginata]|uniref:Uncharacterized protein n=1 Tax=Elysia marginata TaxID=1093978 RepID=A0AAV4IVR4_9GAST|nr:hypothetical protein ElyMa_003128600 [Elysia marginata]